MGSLTGSHQPARARRSQQRSGPGHHHPFHTAVGQGLCVRIGGPEVGPPYARSAGWISPGGWFTSWPRSVLVSVKGGLRPAPDSVTQARMVGFQTGRVQGPLSLQARGCRSTVPMRAGATGQGVSRHATRCKLQSRTAANGIDARAGQSTGREGQPAKADGPRDRGVEWGGKRKSGRGTGWMADWHASNGWSKQKGENGGKARPPIEEDDG